MCSNDEICDYNYEIKEALQMQSSLELSKACHDPFDYAVGLSNGAVIRFTEASFDKHTPGWIHLSEIKCGTLPFPAERGVSIRIKEIVWIMDAPEGS